VLYIDKCRYIIQEQMKFGVVYWHVLAHFEHWYGVSFIKMIACKFEYMKGEELLSYQSKGHSHQ
jgi:hypothetical protein